MPRNEVVITVKARNATKETFAEIRRDAATLGDEIADTVGKQTSTRMEQTGTRNRASYERAGEDIGNVMGERIRHRLQEKVKASFSERFREKVKVDVDVETHGARSGGLVDKDKDKNSIKVKVDVDEDSRRSFVDRVRKMADDASVALHDKLKGVLLTALSPKGLAIATLFVPLTSAIGSAVSAGILLAIGGGVLAVGIASAFKDPRILGAANDLGEKIKKMTERFGEPFRGPVANFLEKFAHFLDTSAPKLQGLADIFAPIADQLGTGIIGMLQNMLPGIIDAAEAAAPLFETLAAHLPDIGQALGDFFSKISENGPEANQFFSDLLSAIEFIIPKIGDLIGIMASWYGSTRKGVMEIKTIMLGLTAYLIKNVFGPILDAAVAAMGWMPGIGPKLRRAQKQFAEFRKDVNSELSRIHDKTVNVTIRKVGASIGGIMNDIARIAGRAAGGIVGAASGGVRSGLKWVGEQGPELMSVPPGTTVHSAADSQRMMRAASGAGGAGSGLTARFTPTGDRVLDELGEWLMERVRFVTRTEGGGSVQDAFGTAGAA